MTSPQSEGAELDKALSLVLPILYNGRTGILTESVMHAKEEILAWHTRSTAKEVLEAQVDENESIRHMLAETVELGRDWCYNHDKYVSQCYACQTAKWTKIIAKRYLESIKERLAQLNKDGGQPHGDSK